MELGHVDLVMTAEIVLNRPVNVRQSTSVRVWTPTLEKRPVIRLYSLSGFG